MTGGPEVTLAAEPHHRLQFETESVRVWRAEIPAHGATLLHRHTHDHVVVNVTAAEVEIEHEGRRQRSAVEAGSSSFKQAAGEHSYAHVVRNLSDHAYINIVVELLR